MFNSYSNYSKLPRKQHIRTSKQFIYSLKALWHLWIIECFKHLQSKQIIVAVSWWRGQNHFITQSVIQRHLVHLQGWICSVCIAAGLMQQDFNKQLGDTACSRCLTVRTSPGWSSVFLFSTVLFTDCSVLDVAGKELENMYTLPAVRNRNTEGVLAN